MDDLTEAIAVALPYQKAKMLIALTPDVQAGRFGWIAPNTMESGQKQAFLFSLATNPDLTFRVYDGEFSFESW